MITTADAYPQMFETLSNCESCANALLDVLKTERESLATQDQQRIKEIAARKSALVERLDEYEAYRMRLCQSTSTAAENTNEAASHMQGFLKRFDDSAQTLSMLWATISTIIVSCRELNIANGAIIRLRQHHFESSLAILRGDVSDNGTYQRSGGNTARHASQSIVEA